MNQPGCQTALRCYRKGRPIESSWRGVLDPPSRNSQQIWLGWKDSNLQERGVKARCGCHFATPQETQWAWVELNHQPPTYQVGYLTVDIHARFEVGTTLSPRPFRLPLTRHLQVTRHEPKHPRLRGLSPVKREPLQYHMSAPISPVKAGIGYPWRSVWNSNPWIPDRQSGAIAAMRTLQRSQREFD